MTSLSFSPDVHLHEDLAPDAGRAYLAEAHAGCPLPGSTRRGARAGPLPPADRAPGSACSFSFRRRARSTGTGGRARSLVPSLEGSYVARTRWGTPPAGCQPHP